MPTPLPGVVEGEDLWTLEVPPEPSQQVGFRWRVPVFIAGFVALFLLGVVIALSGLGGLVWGWFQPAVRSAAPVAVVAPAWAPGAGPLERGLLLASEPPQAIRWSPEGDAIAWVAFDARKGVPVARSVPVAAGYGEPQALTPMPDWVRTPVATTLSVSMVRGGLVLMGPDGATVALIDLAGQYGYVDPRLPALSEAGGKVRVAFVASAPGVDDAARATLHVLDVTSLVAPPAAAPVQGTPNPPIPG